MTSLATRTCGTAWRGRSQRWRGGGEKASVCRDPGRQDGGRLPAGLVLPRLVRGGRGAARPAGSGARGRDGWERCRRAGLVVSVRPPVAGGGSDRHPRAPLRPPRGRPGLPRAVRWRLRRATRACSARPPTPWQPALSLKARRRWLTSLPPEDAVASARTATTCSPVGAGAADAVLLALFSCVNDLGTDVDDVFPGGDSGDGHHSTRPSGPPLALCCRSRRAGPPCPGRCPVPGAGAVLLRRGASGGMAARGGARGGRARGGPRESQRFAGGGPRDLRR